MTYRPHGAQLSDLLPNLLLAAAYAGIGSVGLAIALAPGFATPLFMPAGFALAALVRGGRRLLPGVALGAFLLDLVSLPRAAGISGMPLIAAAVVAAGAATLQAYVAWRAFGRWIRPAIGSGRDVLRFLALCPTAGLVSSTLSLGALALLGIVPPAELPANWSAWWMGDTLGMLLGAPLAWAWFGEPAALWRRRRWTVGAPVLVLTALFVVLFVQVRRWEHEQQMAQVRLKAQQAADLLQAKLSEHERFLYAMASAISGHGAKIRPQDFHNIAHGYHARHPEIMTMGWLKPVTDAERDAFEAWAGQHIATGFKIREPGPDGKLRTAARRDRYLVATYIEPRGSHLYLGLDALSEPRRRSVVETAIATGEPTSSPPLRLFRDDLPKGVSLVQAVRPEDGGEPVGVLVISMELNRYLGSVLRQVGFPHLLASLRDEATGDYLVAPAEHGGEGAIDHMLRFGGRQYGLVLTPAPSYLAEQRDWQSWLVLSAGLLLTSLLGGLLLLSSGEQAAIRSQVEAGTAQLQEREARLQAILDGAADAILTIAGDGTLLGANGAAARLFGRGPESMAGLSVSRLLELPEGGAPAVLRAIAAGPAHEHEATGRRADGGAFPAAISVSEVALPGEHLFVVILHDLTEQRRAQERIYRLAHHDPLTGLDNRLSLNLRLDQLLAQARRDGGSLAVMFLDLDHFKKINDTHGHQTGDQLLLAVASRLRALLGEADTVARLGGDEFIVVTGRGVTPDAASHLAARIVETLAGPYPLQGLTVHSGASVGVAMYPGDGTDAGTLLRHADTAMYVAKSRGRGNFQFFSAEMNAATHERLMLESRLWQALEQQEFELYLQPQIDLPTGAVIGAEGLLRWHHPELGTVGPDRFIPIAEESGLILPLGEWVLQRAVALLERWRGTGLAHLRLAVNLSARQCHGTGLLAQLDRLLAETGVDPALLELEITESAAMQDPERSRALLQQLRARGIRVAIDDFGTGYSSLSYLKMFELDRIKIDRGFVKDIETDPDDAVIVGATIGLAHSLGLEVIAEGVETPAQADFLRSRRCDEAQGYLFARPMTLADFERLADAGSADLRRA